MSNVYFSSDWHEGHSNIGKFRKIPKEFVDAALGNSTLANTLWLDANWLAKERDVVHCLGDATFTEEAIDVVSARLGDKRLLGGNHDDLPLESLLRAFTTVRGCMKKYGFWMSHFPLHPAELRGKFCVHGHNHYQEIDDYRYINVCCDNLWENIGRPFITLAELRTVIEKRKVSKKVEWL